MDKLKPRSRGGVNLTSTATGIVNNTSTSGEPDAFDKDR